MKVICLSASLRFEKEIETIINQSEKVGIKALFPNFPVTEDKDALTVERMKKLCQDHFDAITQAEALYVINPGGYIGTLVKIEIGFALGKNKPVYFSHATDSVDLDSLSTGVIPLDSIEKFLGIKTEN